MARLSKSHHFKIFSDSGIPTPPGNEYDPFNDIAKSPRDSTTSSNPETPSRHHQRYSTANDPPSDADDDEDAIPRDSLTSVSTFPESTSQHNDTHCIHAPASPQKFFTPQIIRPSFRRPESVRRMQMSSPRQSILSHYKSSRSGTPQSDYGRGSPWGRRMITEELTSDNEEAEEEKEHPLVLLHVALLPIALPWSIESMEELLPAQVLEHLMLLRSKVSDIVQQRGILIPHPREEYEMLEERLLEALELKEERLTKCGHFLGRVSDCSSGRDSDSGLGSSVNSSDEDGEMCATCRHHVRCVAGKKQRWSVKVFAANGLMRASAWAAAWDGMESVDVEILPWIGEEHRRKLDRRKEEEGRERKVEMMEGERETQEMMLLQQESGWDEMLRLQQERGAEAKHEAEVESFAGARHTDNAAPELLQTEPGHCQRESLPSQHQQNPSTQDKTTHDLPPIYHASQVPLSVLLRNYIYLLAQDRRIVAAFFLVILGIFFAARSITARPNLALASVDYQPLDALLVVSQDETMAKGHQQDEGTSGIASVTEMVLGVLGDDEEMAISSLEDIPGDFEAVS